MEDGDSNKSRVTRFIDPDDTPALNKPLRFGGFSTSGRVITALPLYLSKRFGIRSVGPHTSALAYYVEIRRIPRQT
jgi:hypothetical protein